MLICCAQAADLSPADMAAALELLLADERRFHRGLHAWQRHISAAAESAVSAAESSVGMEGLHEAALASAQAAVAAVTGFTAQVDSLLPLFLRLYAGFALLRAVQDDSTCTQGSNDAQVFWARLYAVLRVPTMHKCSGQDCMLCLFPKCYTLLSKIIFSPVLSPVPLPTCHFDFRW